MNYDEYMTDVYRGVWPETPIVPLPNYFQDNRGIIQNLTLLPITSTAIITSTANSVRANHYHLSDFHFTYLISGQMLYFEREVDSSVIPNPLVIDVGTLFFTPPMREHIMYFIQDSMMVTMAKNIRSHEQHEADLVRVKFWESINQFEYNNKGIKLTITK